MNNEINLAKIKVVALFYKLKASENFNLHPQAVFESEFVSVGNDIEKKKQTDKFTKRLRAMSKDMDDVHVSRAKIMSVLRDFPCLFKLVANNHGYGVIAKQYGLLSKALKDYAKVMKAQKKNPEIVELQKDYVELETLNVFDLMMEDLKDFVPVVEEKIQASKQKYPDFVPRSEVSSVIDMEVIKVSFKGEKPAE